ncbi:hypothetical protein LPA07_29470 [Lactiplantibacillus paraplantarum]|nr:hypothetical protein LPA07_29470 [Lactiplantibacillus paraplantarum]
MANLFLQFGVYIFTINSSGFFVNAFIYFKSTQFRENCLTLVTTGNLLKIIFFTMKGFYKGIGP